MEKIYKNRQRRKVLMTSWRQNMYFFLIHLIEKKSNIYVWKIYTFKFIFLMYAFFLLKTMKDQETGPEINFKVLLYFLSF